MRRKSCSFLRVLAQSSPVALPRVVDLSLSVENFPARVSALHFAISSIRRALDDTGRNSPIPERASAGMRGRRYIAGRLIED